MTSIALALAIASSSQYIPSWQVPRWWTGRIVTTPQVHVGVRLAAFVDDERGLEVGLGGTVQVTSYVLQ